MPPKSGGHFSKFLSDLAKDKEQYEAVLYDPKRPVEAISTGSRICDLVTGVGGLLIKRRISEISGLEASGKTTLCLQSAANAQKAGWVGVFVDTEQAFDDNYAKKLGLKIDYETFMVLQPSFAEEAEYVIDLLLKDTNIDYIIIDSLAAMRPEGQMYAKDSTGSGQVKAAHATFWANYAPKLQRIATDKNIAVLITNQLRQKVSIGAFETKAVKSQGLGTGYSQDDSWITTGGNAVKFYFSLRCTLNYCKALYVKVGDSKFPIGNIIEFKNVKNKLAPPYSKARFFIRFQKDEYSPKPFGTDDVPAIEEFLGDRKIIKRSAHNWVITDIDGSKVDLGNRDTFFQKMYEDGGIFDDVFAVYKHNWDIFRTEAGSVSDDEETTEVEIGVEE